MGHHARAIAALALAASGCVSHASGLGATPVPDGDRETAVGVSVLSFERGRDRAITPSPDIAHRRGLSQTCDAGGRLALVHAEIDARCLVANGDGVAFALAPQLALGMQPATNNETDLLYARLAIRAVADITLSPTWAVSVATRPALVATGPATIFRGVSRAREWRKGRWLVQPSLSLGLRRHQTDGSETRFELGVVPSLASEGRAPALQVFGGVAIRL